MPASLMPGLATEADAPCPVVPNLSEKGYINYQLSTINCQLSTVNCQLSTVTYFTF
jgi:hypothetical protein